MSGLHVANYWLSIDTVFTSISSTNHIKRCQVSHIHRKGCFEQKCLILDILHFITPCDQTFHWILKILYYTLT